MLILWSKGDNSLHECLLFWLSGHEFVDKKVMVYMHFTKGNKICQWSQLLSVLNEWRLHITVTFLNVCICHQHQNLNGWKRFFWLFWVKSENEYLLQPLQSFYGPLTQCTLNVFQIQNIYSSRWMRWGQRDINLKR